MNKEIKGTLDITEMKVEQCISWLKEISSKDAIGSTEQVAFPKIISHLENLYKKDSNLIKGLEVKAKKQKEIIDFCLDKLPRKDMIILTTNLIEEKNGKESN